MFCSLRQSHWSALWLSLVLFGACGSASGRVAANDKNVRAGRSPMERADVTEQPNNKGDGTTAIVGQSTATEAEAEDNASADTSVQGEVQHCVYQSRCMEFRAHRPSCYPSNQENCTGSLSGTYGLGPCPDTENKTGTSHQTACGLTVVF